MKKISTRIILSVVIVILGAFLLIMPTKENNPYKLDARELLQEMKTESNMMSVDDLASYLINQDPSIRIIDVRDTSEYKEFTLPGAFNIPLDSVNTENASAYLDQDIVYNVFISNGTMRASEAWMICRSKGYENIYILKGGLNEWFNLIINPQPPKNTEDTEAVATYQRRLGAKQYFTGSKVDSKPVTAPVNIPINNNDKKSVEGGCG